MDLHRIEQKKREMNGSAPPIKIYRNGGAKVVIANPECITNFKFKQVVSENKSKLKNSYKADRNCLLYSSRKGLPSKSLEKFSDIIKA